MNRINLKLSGALLLLITSGCSWQNNQSDKTNTDLAKNSVASENWVANPVDYVDPFIGTEGVNNHRQAANVVPGAVVPYGMLNFGPEHVYSADMLAESKRSQRWVVDEKRRIPVSAGGYNYGATRVKGFSLTRLSGTGCLGASGDIPILPFTNAVKHSPDTDDLDAYYSAGFSHQNETAIPGYYQVGLDNGVNVELAATTRTGIAQFRFPKNKSAKLLFRTSYSQLGSEKAQTQVDLDKNEISGSVTSGNFCGYLGQYNQRSYYTLHFVAKLDKKIMATGAWEDDAVKKGKVVAKGGMGYGKGPTMLDPAEEGQLNTGGVPELGKGSGVWVEFETEEQQKVVLRVGISYVSVENARKNLQAEQQASSSFNTIRQSAYQQWHTALSKVQVESNNQEKLKTFYTALYHSQFHPNIFSDVNGEYWGFDQKKHQVTGKQTNQYANFSGWDVYRSQLQLVSLLDKKRASDIAQSLFNQAKQNNGVWDRWTHNSGATGVMSGDPATIAIANFVAFGANDFDVNGAYQSLWQAATEPTSLDLSDVGCPVFCRGQRPSLDQWLKLNYISAQSNSWEGASETLEQVSADFALAQLAKRLHKEDESNALLKRSGYWKNLFNPNATESLGYIQARNKDGSWKDKFDPFSESLFVEGSPAQYLWMLPFDGQGLSQLLGGDDLMVKRLDEHFHKEDGSWVLFRDSGQYADVSNQPSIVSPWMYLFAGRADKTQQTIRATIEQLWNNSTKGIPGQDDAGQMSSWYVFSSMGIYPLYPGKADLVLTSPLFKQVKIGNLTIKAENASAENQYIQSLTVNGKPSNQSWINESYINQPMTLEFDLGNTPQQSWGQGLQDRPPSYSIN
ncbi:GH92 family glycosyl hydrolase [Aliikangiella sp. IMCC44359]|uniref:GH92 family glycosyl hydrolase n=1 Tax=Aliikangiella sp. IMCC44359 TaxID=3459125 RepID=UPI00403AE6CA